MTKVNIPSSILFYMTTILRCSMLPTTWAVWIEVFEDYGRWSFAQTQDVFVVTTC